MIVIFESVLPVFLLIAAGAVLRRSPIISETAWPGMEQLTYWFLYPALLFVSIYNADFSTLQLDALLAALLFCLFLMGALTLALWPAMRRSGIVAHSEYSSVFQTSIRWNAFIALPVAQAVFPPEGATVVALTMAVIIIPINIVSVFVVSRFANREMSLGRTFLRVALNPLIIGAGSAVLLRLAPFDLYQPINETLGLVGAAALGIGLLAIGANLRATDLAGMRGAVWLPVVIKLAVFPTVMIGVAKLLGITGPQLQYLVLCAAVPTATNGYLLARQLGGDAELYAVVATLQTALSVLTLPAALTIAAQLSSG